MGTLRSTFKLYLICLIPYTAGILIGMKHYISGFILYVTVSFFNVFLAEWIKKG